MDQKFNEIVADLKSYLEYLKGMGIEDLPFSERDTSSPPSPMAPTLEEVRKELGDCQRCKLHRTRRTLVFGEGNEKARLMLIGEGPGSASSKKDNSFESHQAQDFDSEEDGI